MRAATALDHVRREHRGQRNRRLDEHADLFEFSLGVRLVKCAVRGEARVVDEDLDLEPERLDLGRQLLARGRLTEVAGDGLGANPVVGFEILGELVEPVLAPRDEHEIVAARGQFTGELGADPGGGAGDEGSGAGAWLRQAHGAIRERTCRRSAGVVPPNGGKPLPELYLPAPACVR